MMMKKQTMTK